MAAPATAPQASNEPHVKGLAFERLLDWYARTHGEDRLRAVVDALPAELKQHLDAKSAGHGVLANVWYPATLAHGLLNGMTRGLSAKQRTELADAGAEAIIRANLRGVYKVLFQLFMTPERYANRAQALWDRYYDTGIVTKTIESPTKHVSVIAEWRSHHPVLCEMNASSGRIIYEELGCKNVKVERTACVAWGAPACTQIITWGDKAPEAP